jgi:hypothetical protein
MLQHHRCNNDGCNNSYFSDRERLWSIDGLSEKRNGSQAL